ncbi:unnamed protein product [Amoebophrya sp. A120]|nr:unnamed protein product [Amoebophrya sp. A120]|eukprot:GSA120T00023449001.1
MVFLLSEEDFHRLSKPMEKRVRYLEEQVTLLTKALHDANLVEIGSPNACGVDLEFMEENGSCAGLQDTDMILSGHQEMNHEHKKMRATGREVDDIEVSSSSCRNITSFTGKIQRCDTTTTHTTDIKNTKKAVKEQDVVKNPFEEDIANFKLDDLEIEIDDDAEDGLALKPHPATELPLGGGDAMNKNNDKKQKPANTSRNAALHLPDQQKQNEAEAKREQIYNPDSPGFTLNELDGIEDLNTRLQQEVEGSKLGAEELASGAAGPARRRDEHGGGSSLSTSKQETNKTDEGSNKLSFLPFLSKTSTTSGMLPGTGVSSSSSSSSSSRAGLVNKGENKVDLQTRSFQNKTANIRENIKTSSASRRDVEQDRGPSAIKSTRGRQEEKEATALKVERSSGGGAAVISMREGGLPSQRVLLPNSSSSSRGLAARRSRSARRPLRSRERTGGTNYPPESSSSRTTRSRRPAAPPVGVSRYADHLSEPRNKHRSREDRERRRHSPISSRLLAAEERNKLVELPHMRTQRPISERVLEAEEKNNRKNVVSSISARIQLEEGHQPRTSTSRVDRRRSRSALRSTTRTRAASAAERNEHEAQRSALFNTKNPRRFSLESRKDKETPKTPSKSNSEQVLQVVEATGNIGIKFEGEKKQDKKEDTRPPYSIFSSGHNKGGPTNKGNYKPPAKVVTVLPPPFIPTKNKER